MNARKIKIFNSIQTLFLFRSDLLRVSVIRILTAFTWKLKVNKNLKNQLSSPNNLDSNCFSIPFSFLSVPMKNSTRNCETRYVVAIFICRYFFEITVGFLN